MFIAWIRPDRHVIATRWRSVAPRWSDRGAKQVTRCSMSFAWSGGYWIRQIQDLPSDDRPVEMCDGLPERRGRRWRRERSIDRGGERARIVGRHERDRQLGEPADR